MGDITTHAVKYSAYWHLAYLQDGVWTDSNTGEPICGEFAADLAVNLP